jgi:hypothetical protein
MSKSILSRAAQLRAQGLLDMLYKPSELAAELGLATAQIYRRLIPSGLPHLRDKAKHIWIHGSAVTPWLKQCRPSRRPLAPDEGYCVKCRRPVLLVNPRRENVGTSILLKANCPTCGQPIFRGAKRDDPAR